jgi:hypothetical protein
MCHVQMTLWDGVVEKKGSARNGVPQRWTDQHFGVRRVFNFGLRAKRSEWYARIMIYIIVAFHGVDD